MTNDLSFASARQTAEAVRTGKITATETANAATREIDARNAELNCFTRVDEQDAQTQAQSIDAKVLNGLYPGPLAGVPIAVKDLFDIAGLTTMAGAKIRRNAPPATKNAVVLERLKAAGAVLIGTLNMDEFAYGFATDNSHFGVTHNPFDKNRLAGGSSGGSAAAVAAGLAAVTLGSDTNGSVRVPASLCGVYGLRPTHGTLPLDGVFPFVERLDTVGVFARTIDDLAITFSIAANQAVTRLGDKPLRVGRLGGWFAKNADPDGLVLVQKAAACLGSNAVLDLPLAKAARSAAFLITAYEGGRLHWDRLKKDAMGFDPAVRDRLLAGLMVGKNQFKDAEVIAARFTKQVHAAFENFDVLIAPSTPSVAPRIDEALIEITVRWYPHAPIWEFTPNL